MDTVAVETKSRGRFGPYVIAVPFATIIFGFYGTFLPFGLPGILGFAVAGLLWALFLGFIARRLMRREAGSAWLANTPLFLGIIAIGLTIGGGYMYASLTSAALNEPSMTYAILSALMKPAVPYYIILNTLLELFLVSLIVFGNWDTGPKRKTLILIGVVSYLAMRIWTYLVFAETRLEISTQTLSEADVEWFKRTLATDFRIVLNMLTYVSFLLAAFVPFRSSGDTESKRVLPASR
jgi:hypothetical protein